MVHKIKGKITDKHLEIVSDVTQSADYWRKHGDEIITQEHIDKMGEVWSILADLKKQQERKKK